jgi:hypothetical protein
MEEFPVSEDTFVFSYPVFFLLDPKPPVSFVSSPLIGEPGIGIHVFTDEPAADEYLAANPQPPGVIKHEARNRATFAAKVEILAEQDKFTHLIIDARGPGARPRRCISIKDLLEYFQHGGR